jgi:hypothetical protein
MMTNTTAKSTRPVLTPARLREVLAQAIARRLPERAWLPVHRETILAAVLEAVAEVEYTYDIIFKAGRDDEMEAGALAGSGFEGVSGEPAQADREGSGRPQGLD